MLFTKAARVVGLAAVLLILVCTPAAAQTAETTTTTTTKVDTGDSKVKEKETTHYPDTCAKKCQTQASFAKPLPEAPSGEGNRPYEWSIVMLNLIKDNLGTISPPGVARGLGIFSLCMYEALSLFESEGLESWISEIEKLPSELDEYKDKVIDGAAYTALRSMSIGTDSFDKVKDGFKTINGSSARETKFYVALDYMADDIAAQMREDSGLESLNDFSALALGVLACRAVIEKFKEDGYNALARSLYRIPEFEFQIVNDPQQRAGLTDCKEQIKDLDKWQPLCTPKDRSATGAVGDANCEVQTWLAPWAGCMTTFAIPEGTPWEGDALIDAVKETQEMVMGRPPLVDEGVEWREQMLEVLDAASNLDEVFKLIAEHWADGPDSTAPPGAWFLIANQAALAEKLNTTETAKLLMLVGLSLNDAGVASWRVKSTYDSIRPLQMIQCGFLDKNETVDSWAGPYQGVQEVKTVEWQPYQLDTPPFGGYVSEHSTFSSAAAEALALFFGSDKYLGPPCQQVQEGQSVFERKITKQEEGWVEGVTDVPNTGKRTVGYSPSTDVVLCWDTFSDAARQAGQSRIYGGIHVKADDVDGAGLGIEVARSVFVRASALFGDRTDVKTAL